MFTGGTATPNAVGVPNAQFMRMSASNSVVPSDRIVGVTPALAVQVSDPPPAGGVVAGLSAGSLAVWSAE